MERVRCLPYDKAQKVGALKVQSMSGLAIAEISKSVPELLLYY